MNARDEIHDFTDEINDVGSGYNLGKDFVLKGALYLTDGLPIQYKVKNFTKPNLEMIEDNWETIKKNLLDTVRLISRFGFGNKNLISTLALLPVAFYLRKANKKNFIDSTQKNDVRNQLLIQKWLAIALLKNAFGSSSDTILKNIQDVLNAQPDFSIFPYAAINEKLGIESGFTDAEINNLLATAYGSKYSYLILSLLYPDRDWRDNTYHEDHIFPKSSFTLKNIKAQGVHEEKIESYQSYFNTVINLQLLTANENLEKNAMPFDEWLPTRDEKFKQRHSIPEMNGYNFDQFIDFIEQRRASMSEKLKQIAM